MVADLLVVMARVPKGDGHRGGITAFVVEAAAAGITVERRNAFMGLRGLENGVTRFHEVRIPAASRIGEEGQGLKIALTTLNTGRLALPASCAAAGKLALKIAREWSRERVQWGRPIGEHEAVAKQISSACVRAQLDATAGSGTERGAAAPELAGLFCAQARLRAEELFSQLWSNTDTADSALARRVLAGRYSWLEDGIIDPSIPGPWIAPAEPGHPRREMPTATSSETANRRRTSRSATHTRSGNPTGR